MTAPVIRTLHNRLDALRDHATEESDFVLVAYFETLTALITDFANRLQALEADAGRLDRLAERVNRVDLKACGAIEELNFHLVSKHGEGAPNERHQ